MTPPAWRTEALHVDVGIRHGAPSHRLSPPHRPRPSTELDRRVRKGDVRNQPATKNVLILPLVRSEELIRHEDLERLCTPP